MRRKLKLCRNGAILSLCAISAACATVPLEQTGQLSSYERMSQSDGMLTKSLIRVDKDAVMAAKTVRITPTAFQPSAAPNVPTAQRELVANAIDRSVCLGLSERFVVVAADAEADLTVRAVVSYAATTNEVAAGVSKVAGMVPSFLSLGVPVPVPRLPIGLGGLSVESEAVDRDGKQVSAMVWARGADAFTSSARVSKIGDAYELAAAFGDDFSRLLVTGETPFGKLAASPSMAKIGSTLGAKPKYRACEIFGKDPGVADLVAGRLGLPPEWTDNGDAPPSSRVRRPGKSSR